jgi:hypothetical protein
MRRALHQLGKLAERQDCAIILLRHLNKAAQSKAIYRGGGSIGIIASARAGILVARDPAQERVRVVLVTKSNLAHVPPGLKYELVPHDKTVAVAWRGTSFARPDAILQANCKEEAVSVLEDAVRLLMDLLTERDQSYREILKEAKTAGISERTLRTAKTQLGVRSYRVNHPGTGAKWLWSLKSAKEAESNAVAVQRQRAKAQTNPGGWTDLLGDE